MPAQITLPQEFRLTLEWMEAQGYIHTFRNRSQLYGSLYPTSIGGLGSSLVTIQTCDAERVNAWVRGNAAGKTRLAPIIRTGGDGSYAALWLDNAGHQKFVHLGSGSGSTWLGVVCDDPVDMLRLMSIGYHELCWPDVFDKTPSSVYNGDEYGQGPYLAPVAFRAFVETAFGVKVPATAGEIVKHTASMLDASSDDPFWTWIKGFDK